MQHSSASPSELTLAGVGVGSLGRPPRQVVVEVAALLAVQSLGVVVAHAPAVHLRKEITIKKTDYSAVVSSGMFG